jgi:dipeptidyl aminopeptidase/acylaminoacyl peptidase
MNARASAMGCLLLAVFASGWTSNAVGSGPAAQNLFFDEGVAQVRVSPNGEWIVATANKGDVSGILAQRVGRLQVEHVLSRRANLRWIYWAGRNTVIAEFKSGDNRAMLRVDFTTTEAGEISFETTSMPVHGWLVDSLPLVDGVILWAMELNGTSTLHRIELDSIARRGTIVSATRRLSRLGEIVASIEGTVVRWIVDRQGRPVAAKRVDEDGHTILFRPENQIEFREVASFPTSSKEVLTPLALAPDGETLLAFTYNGHDTLGLFEFDPETAKIGKEIYRRDDADLTGISIDYLTRDLRSVSYEIDGDTRLHYLETARRAYIDRIGKLPGDFPVESVWIVSSSADRQRFVYWVSNATEPGTHYFRNLPLDETTLVGQRAAHIDRKTLSPTESFDVESGDGTHVEAFLTRPRAPRLERSPLIVMPHGGPIGVRDLKEFDPLVQYLAGWGFAVLQPNYRGSAGYGRKFRLAGRKEWAEGIEDDIDAAVEYAMALPGIDADRVCIVGGSYGGFSAIASVIRHKNRYRCAVTINGVSDVPLLYESSDSADSKPALAFFEEFVGNLETEREMLIEISPAYHTREIDSPVLLVYGDRDRRVDPDHSHRLALMLRLHGLEYEEIIVAKGHHSFTSEQWIEVAPALRRFLTKHMIPEIEFEKDPVGD